MSQIPIADDVVVAAEMGAPAAPPSGPAVIEVRDVSKTFHIPTHRVDTLRERMIHPLRKTEFRELQVLRDVSFDIRRGEFFGIVGRNGSGKSTLLKILASIYGADSGSIRMAGRLAPFIELGVGFDQDLAARENVILNGVMMGLSRREAERRLDAVLDFAELRDFADLQLKNYSSGMNVRLAFSVMIQSDADILLIDEVLAVGDAAFQQKCADVFHEMRDSGRTMVLVTHDMAAVQAYCHRAMLLQDGVVRKIGDPEEVGREYLRMNFGGTSVDIDGNVIVASPDVHARLISAHIRDESGDRVDNVEEGKPIRFEAVIEARDDLVNPVFGLHCVSADEQHVFGFNRTMNGDGPSATLLAGKRVRLTGAIENRLTPGRYSIKCWVTRDRRPGDMAMQAIDLLDFVVFGTSQSAGLVKVDADVEVVPEREDDGSA